MLTVVYTFHYMEEKKNILADITQQGMEVELEKGKEQYYSNIILACSSINMLYETLVNVRQSKSGEGDSEFFRVATEQVGSIIDQLSGVAAVRKNPLLAQTAAGIQNAVESGSLSVTMKYGLRSKVEALLAILAVKEAVVDIEV